MVVIDVLCFLFVSFTLFLRFFVWFLIGLYLVLKDFSINTGDVEVEYVPKQGMGM